MKLSALLSDGMVLQRGEKCRIWGQTQGKRRVVVTFLSETYETLSNEQGDWEIVLKNLLSGGPYVMVLEDGEKRVIKDILIGDVWLLGGQSNMELPIRRTLDLYEEEVKNVVNSNIRMFQVPQRYDFNEPVKELKEGCWRAVSKETINDFSAVGYFFSKELEESYNIPIGFIQTAVGGTPAQAWISEKTLENIGGYEQELKKNKDFAFVQETIKKEGMRNSEWFLDLQKNDPGFKENNWCKENFNVKSKKLIHLPGMFQGRLKNWIGSIWFKKDFVIELEEYNRLTEEMKNLNNAMQARLRLGTLVDADETYINGELVGSTGYKYPPRIYDFPVRLLKAGKNVVTVRLISNNGGGGFVQDKKYLIQAGSLQIDLSGEWEFQFGAKGAPLPATTFFQYKPSGLYQGMLYPLRKYGILGAAFYQGESNTEKPDRYERLFTALIEDWRSLFQKDFPFLFVQLANYGGYEKAYKDTGWAALREEQRKCLKLKKTAMAVAIDAGEYNDLHPLNKKTIGHRLALCAKSLAYSENIVSSGPLIEKKILVSGGIRLVFTDTGGGIIKADGDIRNFFIAGEDKKFVKANAVIESKNTVYVYSNEVTEPQYVQYAWEDSPERINFYNKEGLPASPFRI